MRTIYWAGDSTVKQNTMLTYPQTGIGQGFERYVRRGEVTICNCAENGRSTRSFIDEGRLAPIADNIREGDLLFIQFGHNDEKAADPARYTDPDGDYAANLETFVNAARSKGATPVIITPLTRRLFREGDALYRHEAWAASARRTAQRLNVALVDLTAMSEALVGRLGDAAKALYMHLPAGVYPAYPNGSADNTHLTPEGAMAFAGLIARRLHQLGGVYAQVLCEEFEDWMAMDDAASASAPSAAPAGGEAPDLMDEDAAVGYGSASGK